MIRSRHSMAGIGLALLVAACSPGAGGPGGSGGTESGGAAGTGGDTTGSAGTSGAAGTAGTGGGEAGTTGTAGTTGKGASSGRGGTTGTAGTTGQGGSAGRGGTTGTAGTTGAAGTGAGGSTTATSTLVTSASGAYWKTGTWTESTGTATVTVNDANAYQTWEGFGGAFNETANDTAMSNFSIARDQMRLIPYIRAAQAVKSNIRFWASPWTPPTWMKTGPYNPGSGPSHSNFDGGVMKSDDATLKAFALYLVRFVQAYAAQGINVEVVSPQNEPNYQQNYPSCHWDTSLFVTFVGK